jgi:DNA-binding transcriptional MocR family regulator
MGYGPPMNSPSRARSGMLYQGIASVLRHQIVTGVLPPGTELSGEIDMAADYGVSRYTLREALRVLEDEGLIERRSGRRTRVSPGASAAELVVVVGHGVQITARLPVPGEPADQAGSPLLVVEYPGRPPLLYPAARTVLVTGR